MRASLTHTFPTGWVGFPSATAAPARAVAAARVPPVYLSRLGAFSIGRSA
jgi:hypothetical protein